MRILAISEQARIYRSFSGGNLDFLGLEGGGTVMVMVAMVGDWSCPSGPSMKRINQGQRLENNKFSQCRLSR